MDIKKLVKEIMIDITGKQLLAIVLVTGLMILISQGHNGTIQAMLLLVAAYFFTKETDRKRK